MTTYFIDDVINKQAGSGSADESGDNGIMQGSKHEVIIQMTITIRVTRELFFIIICKISILEFGNKNLIRRQVQNGPFLDPMIYWDIIDVYHNIQNHRKVMFYRKKE